MYLTLEINEQFASAMRAAAEFKVEVEKIIEGQVIDEECPISTVRKEYEHMSDSICDMMILIGNTIGNMITEKALNEVRKVNLRNNLNIESHVSK